MSIVEANELTDGTRLESTICIVGGGPAGISLALRLAELGVDSLLLESGGREFDEDAQALADGESHSYVDLATTRVRRLGGTSHHWGGQSRPFEAVDFEPHDWRDGHGWPIERTDALGHLDAAAAFLGLAPQRWTLLDWYPDAPPLATQDVEAPDLEEPDLEEPDLEEKVFQVLSMSVGEAYAGDLEESTRVQVVLGATVTRVRLDETRARVAELDVQTLGGTSLVAVAEVYVLATGGIEAPRLLLASSDDIPAGVGNSSGLVGRYFSDHPILGPYPLVPGPGAVRPETVVAPTTAPDRTDRDIMVPRSLAATEEAQRRLELPGFHAFLLEAERPFDDEVLAQGVERLVSLGGPDPGAVHSVVIGLEQIPNADSRVTLSDDRDTFGEPLAAVDWQLGDDDEAAMQRTMDLLAAHIARAGIGRLRTEPSGARWRDELGVGYHHMGTLRMGTSPGASVVNENLRFHDVGNLYAVGSAVFPTFGHVNPTLNLVALSYRLADHLRNEVA